MQMHALGHRYQHRGITLISTLLLLTQLAIINGLNSTAQAQSPRTPTGVKATTGLYPSMVEVEWDELGGGVSYEIWRGTQNDVSKAQLENTAWWNFYMDYSVIPEQKYYYWIRTSDGFQKSAFSSSAMGYASEGDKSRYTLTINAGNHGKVTRSPSGEAYLTGTSIMLMAIPDLGYKFVEWNGNLKSTDNPLNFNITSNMVINAVFQAQAGSAGTITIYIQPAEVVGAGAKWSIEGEVFWRASGATFATDNLKSYTVKFTFVEGWVTPPDKVITLAANMPNISWTCEYTQGNEKFTLTLQSEHGSISKTPNAEAYAAGTQVELKAQPAAGYTFSRWAGDLQGTENPTKLTIQGNKVVKAIFEPIVPVLGNVKAKQAAGSYTAGGNMALNCTIEYPTDKKLLSLKWLPTLPGGWTLVNATGTGNPEIQQGEIVWTGTLTDNPIKATANIQIPAGQNGGKDISGIVEYQLADMINPAQTQMDPAVLTVNNQSYHSADFREPRWLIDGTEINRVLSYWRSAGYHTEPQGADGYAPGTGAITGARHSADYKDTFGTIDGTEINRLLAYWRAGSYHVEPQGADGYAAGPAAIVNGIKAIRAAATPQITHATQSTYTPGQTIIVTNRIEYSGTLLSLLWRPILAHGMLINQVQGDGSPELQNGEIVWIGAIPNSPITMLYALTITNNYQGLANIQGEVEYQTTGDINPQTGVAQPSPLMLEPQGAPQPTITIQLHSGVQIQGQPGQIYQIESCPDVNRPDNWTVRGQITLPTANATWFDPDPAADNTRFYRVRAAGKP